MIGRSGRVLLGVVVALLFTVGQSATKPLVHERSCSEEEDMSSVQGTTSTVLQIRNGSGAVRDLYWLDYNGRRVFYSRLAPGQDVTQQTYATHPWVVTDSNGRCVSIFIATPREGWIDLE